MRYRARRCDRRTLRVDWSSGDGLMTAQRCWAIIRAIEDLLPVLYPGVKVSYGKVQQLLVEAEARARSFNAQADLSEIESAALDEMFSQGEAVLAGVDLDSGALFALEVCEHRDAQSWGDVLEQGRSQGLNLSVRMRRRVLRRG